MVHMLQCNGVTLHSARRLKKNIHSQQNKKKRGWGLANRLQLLLVFDLHVNVLVDIVGQLRHLNLKARLHIVERVGVLVRRDKGNGQTLGAKTASAGNAVQVRVGRVGHVVVDNNVNTLNVHATAKDVSRDENALLKLLKLLVALKAAREGIIKKGNDW